MMTPDAAQQLTQKVLAAMMESGTYTMRRDAEIDLAALQSYSYRVGYAEGEIAGAALQYESTPHPFNPNNPGAF